MDISITEWLTVKWHVYLFKQIPLIGIQLRMINGKMACLVV